MFYTLILALQYKKYKQPAGVSITVNDKILDTFQLDESKGATNNMLANLERSCLEKVDKKYWTEREDWVQCWKEDWPTFYKVYQLDEKELENGTIRIAVDNKNSDYTNGFMKNNSLFRINIVVLVPTCFLRNNSEKYFKIIKKVDDAYNKFLIRNVKKSLEDRQTKEEYEFRKHRSIYAWPMVQSFTLRKEFRQDESEVSDRFNWIGGSFTIDIPVRTKFKIKYLGCPRGKEMSFPDIATPESIIIGAMKQLLNIYNEDQ